MKARVIVFPIRGRNWCFSRSMDQSVFDSLSAHTPSSFGELWKKISSSSNRKLTDSNTELVIDFVSNKMNQAWTGLEKAPPGSFKNKLYGLGLRLLARVKPSEIFLKCITKEVTNVEVIFPSSLNARLARRRLRHIALRGTIIHRRYFYGSVSLLPLTTVFTVLPLPNIPFFWILFRTYSHWRALKGSERLLQLISDNSENRRCPGAAPGMTKNAYCDSEKGLHNPVVPPWVLQPSKELAELIQHGDTCKGLSNCIISDICQAFSLNKLDVLKYHASM
ncbi:hypothetical protein NMG60_11003973 [Bertholletia excelsa]